MTRTYEGQLEIDDNRGVIYFHSNEGVTLLRICQLPTPMPEHTLLDITHMHGVDWARNNPLPKREPGATLNISDWP